jgi:hypothetical protein
LPAGVSVWNLSGNPDKATLNREKHDISFEEAATVFNDSLKKEVNLFLAIAHLLHLILGCIGSKN